MEESWEAWDLQMEMDHGNDFLDKCHTYDDDDDEFLRDILLQPSFSSESESDQYHHSFHAATNSYSTTLQNNNNSTTTVGSEVPVLDQLAENNNMAKSDDSSNYSMSQQNASNNNNNNKRPRRSSSPGTYILSFDNSTMTPATPEPEPYLKNHDQLIKGSEGITRSSSNHSPNLPSERAMAEPRVVRDSTNNNNNNNNQQGAKKARNSSKTMEHIMAERKRREELRDRFIALSATIPGLSKTDKASILRAAIDYVKQLQERVQELEKQDKSKRNVQHESGMLVIRRSDLCANIDQDTITTTSSEETSSEECGTLPEIKARVMGKEVLIEILCEKENGIELKILDMLENLHLCVTGSSVLPLGNSTLGITIIAQMGEAYKMTVNDLMKNLKEVLLKSHMACNSDPY